MTWQEAVLRVQEAGAALAAARTEEARQFLRFRAMPNSTDNKARAQAVLETNSQLDIAEAEWKAACAYLELAVDEASREGIPNVAA